jgi:type II secretory pathway component PulK
LIEVMTPRPAQPTPGSGPPDSTQLDVLVADLHDVFELEVLDAAGRRRQAQDGVLRLGVQDQAGGVRLRIAADDQDLLPHLGQRRQGVLRGRRLADATLAVKCDLPIPIQVL